VRSARARGGVGRRAAAATASGGRRHIRVSRGGGGVASLMNEGIDFLCLLFSLRWRWSTSS
jgi:hypothetical protein